MAARTEPFAKVKGLLALDGGLTFTQFSPLLVQATPTKGTRAELYTHVYSFIFMYVYSQDVDQSEILEHLSISNRES